jgi:hypothetical protein
VSLADRPCIKPALSMQWRYHSRTINLIDPLGFFNRRTRGVSTYRPSAKWSSSPISEFICHYPARNTDLLPLKPPPRFLSIGSTRYLGSGSRALAVAVALPQNDIRPLSPCYDATKISLISTFLNYLIRCSGSVYNTGRSLPFCSLLFALPHPTQSALPNGLRKTSSPTQQPEEHGRFLRRMNTMSNLRYNKLSP